MVVRSMPRRRDQPNQSQREKLNLKGTPLHATFQAFTSLVGGEKDS
jgi:hypothetical protein